MACNCGQRRQQISQALASARARDLAAMRTHLAKAAQSMRQDLGQVLARTTRPAQPRLSRRPE